MHMALNIITVLFAQRVGHCSVPAPSSSFRSIINQAGCAESENTFELALWVTDMSNGVEKLLV